MANLITGLFDTESPAESAVAQLKQIGYGQNEITIVMKDRANADNMAHRVGNRAMGGVGTGATIGGVIGAVLAAIFAAGTVVIPGGPLLAAGPLAAALAGAGAGGITGGVIGWLATFGVPEDVAPYYEYGVNNGGVVVAVAAHPGDESRVNTIMRTGSVATTGGTGAYVAPEYKARYDQVNTAGTVKRV